MNYKESISYISSFSSSKTRLGLDGMRIILDELGSIDSRLKFVHVAGTNGKGSTCKMIESILIDSGYKTGLFISPYVIKYNERMQVNSQMIDNDVLAKTTSELSVIIEKHIYNGGNAPNEFEVTTLLAFMFFAKMKCDIVCLEVGLGGLLDPTNVIATPLVSVITAIALDHINILGDNLSDITHQKCGIIKGGITVLYPQQEICVTSIIEKVCKAKNSNLIIPKMQDIEFDEEECGNNLFAYKGSNYIKLMHGECQIYNAVVAIEVAEQLSKLGYHINNDNIIEGIKRAKFPARQEIISTTPIIMLDGGHNLHGVTALCRGLDSMAYNKLTVIMAAMDDKDISGMLEILLPYATTFIAASISNPRAISSSSLASLVASGSFCGEILQSSNLADTIEHEVLKLGERDMLLVCGSLYLASEARECLVDAAARFKFCN